MIAGAHGAVVTLGWPDRASRNAIGRGTAARLRDDLDRAAATSGARVIVIGAGQEPFCSGWDVRDLGDLDASDEAAAGAYFQPGRDLLASLEACPLPVVAVVAGAALGFGCSLLAHADVVLAADDAVFGLPEIRRGFPPATVAPELIDVLGRRELGLWALTGERYDARRARAASLVHVTVAPDALDAAAAHLVGGLAQVPASLLRETKALVRTLPDLDPAERRRHGVALAVGHFSDRRTIL